MAPENSVLIPERSSSKANVAKLLVDEGCTLFTLLNSGVIIIIIIIIYTFV